MVFEKLTLVEFHLETDTFEPSATASVGGRERGVGGRGSGSAGRDSAGWAKLAPVVALIATAAAFAVARRRRRR